MSPQTHRVGPVVQAKVCGPETSTLAPFLRLWIVNDKRGR